MDSRPDYVGNFMLLEDLGQYKERQKHVGMTLGEYNYSCITGMGVFSMFIDTRKRDKEIEIIGGRIIDSYLGREATFEGELNEEHIKFVKKYSDRCANLGELIYTAKRIKSKLFEGTWQKKGDKSWKGKFRLENFFNPTNN